jgi:hypothetical protein
MTDALLQKIGASTFELVQGKIIPVSSVTDQEGEE